MKKKKTPRKKDEKTKVIISKSLVRKAYLFEVIDLHLFWMWIIESGAEYFLDGGDTRITS